MSYTRFFGMEPSPDVPGDLAVLGGKGVNLCELTRAQFDVPPGFIVTTAAYLDFVSANGLGDRIAGLIDDLDPTSSKRVEQVSEEIRSLFKQGLTPPAMMQEVREGYGRLKAAGEERVAVRSSATAEDLPEASFAGQQDTYLNISGEEAVLEAVKDCWGSLWTARAIVYRSQHQIPLEGLALAVVVQQMVMAETAGIMFTVNPLTGARDELVINAAWGLGEAVVGGHVTPDTLIVDKTTGEIRDLVVAEKTVMTAATSDGTSEVQIDDDRRHARVLDDQQAQCLVDIGCRVEKHYGSPQDIEWAIRGDDIYLVQARPVTSLPEDPAVVNEIRIKESDRLHALAEGTRKVWVRHNLHEILPSPTPLTWDIMKEFMNGDGGFGRMYRDMGYKPSDDVCRNGFLELVAGTVYADPDRAANLFWAGMPLIYDLDDVAADPKLMDSAPNKFDPEQADAKFLVSFPRLLRDMMRCSKQMKKMAKRSVAYFDEQVVPRFCHWLDSKKAQNLQKLSTEQLFSELDERIEVGLHRIGAESLKPGFFGGMAHAELEARLAQLMGEEEGLKLSLLLTQGLEGDSTIEQNVALYEVAQGNGTCGEFIAKYGHRGVGEMELANPSYRESDSYLRQILSSYSGGAVQSPLDRHGENAQRRMEAEKELPATLQAWGGSSFREEIMEKMRDAQQMLPYREIGKDYLIMGYDAIRMVVREIASRFDLGEDVFFLTRAELRRYEKDAETLDKLIAERKTERAAAKQLHMPEVIDSKHLDGLGLPPEYDDAAELTGDGVASGVATGPALIVFDPQEVAANKTEYILVCPSTDPSWTALFLHARGVVVEEGGILSHGAIVARDFGIPAVVCPDATRRIVSGQEIRVDGNRGVITLIEEDGKDA